MSRAPDPDEVAAGAVPEDATKEERCFRALMMRNAGATFSQIAEKMGCSETKARGDVRWALRQVVSESREDLIARQRSVLLDLQRAHYQKALGGDIDSTRAILSILERESKLFGLDAPSRVDVGVSELEFAERAAAAIEAMGLAPPAELTRGRVPVGQTAVIDAEIVEPESVPPANSKTGRKTPFDHVRGSDSVKSDSSKLIEPGIAPVSRVDWSNL